MSPMWQAGRSDSSVPKEIADKAIPLQEDLGKVLADILSVKNDIDAVL